MRRTARAVIDLAALRHNLEVARRQTPRSRIMAVVKAEAYGHGMLRTAETLSPSVDAFAVSYVEEGLALREAGIDRPIVAMQGFRGADDLNAAAGADIGLTLHCGEQLRLLETVSVGRSLSVWIKINTGMNRLGFPTTVVREIHGKLVDMPSVSAVAGYMTHFASADEPESAMTARQLAAFDVATEGLAGEHSLANSAAVLAHPSTHRDWVRPGIMLYGASPFVQRSAKTLGLKPAMMVSTPLIAVNEVPAGDAVGYGGTFVCDRRMRVGIAAIGYGDGYPRHAPTGTPILVAGRRTRTLGRVSMDMIALDLNELPHAQVGDEVVAWGEGLSVDEVAASAGTIGYELLCAVGERLRIEVRS